MELRNNLSKARSSSALLKYQKRKIIKQQRENNKCALTNWISMQSINFTGGISDILKNKTSKGKPKNKKMGIRKYSVQSPILTKKNISIHPKFKLGDDSFIGLPQHSGLTTDKNVYKQKKNKRFAKKIETTQKSIAQDTSRSYNQVTKEDSNSSWNITETSNSGEKKINDDGRSSSWLAYYGTPKNNKVNKVGIVASPKALFHNKFNWPGDKHSSSSLNFKQLASSLVEKLKGLKDEDIWKSQLEYETDVWNRLVAKPNLLNEDFVSVILNCSRNVIFEIQHKFYWVIDKISARNIELEETNKTLLDRIFKLEQEVKQYDKGTVIHLLKEKQEPIIFDYKGGLNDHLQINEQTEEMSSAVVSIPLEDSFENTFEYLELRSKLSQSSKESFSIQNDEPKAKNIVHYNMKHERCFDKMKKEIKKQEDNEFNNVNEKSVKNDIQSNLQSNMKKFEQYHIGRNQNMKITKSASVFNL
jgi:hypothetical protein